MRNFFTILAIILWVVASNVAALFERLVRAIIKKSTQPVVVLIHLGTRNLFMFFVRVRYRGIHRKKYLVARRLWRRYRKDRYLTPEDALILSALERDGYVFGWWPSRALVAESKGAPIQKIVWVHSKRPAS